MDTIVQNATLMREAFDLWNGTGKGPLGNIALGITHIAFQRLPQNSTAFSFAEDPSAGPGTPHLELVIEVSLQSAGSMHPHNIAGCRGVCAHRKFYWDNNWSTKPSKP